MSFDLDKDLTEDFNELIGGKKKKKGDSVADFDFSRENAAKLDLGFDDAIGDDPIEEGHKRITGQSGKKRRKN